MIFLNSTALILQYTRCPYCICILKCSQSAIFMKSNNHWFQTNSKDSSVAFGKEKKKGKVLVSF